jgi:hypothetical protein
MDSKAKRVACPGLLEFRDYFYSLILWKDNMSDLALSDFRKENNSACENASEAF